MRRATVLLSVSLLALATGAASAAAVARQSSGAPPYDGAGASRRSSLAPGRHCGAAMVALRTV